VPFLSCSNRKGTKEHPLGTPPRIEVGWEVALVFLFVHYISAMHIMDSYSCFLQSPYIRILSNAIKLRKNVILRNRQVTKDPLKSKGILRRRKASSE